MPSENEISTHIIKPQPKNAYQGLIESEAWAMASASFAARCARVALIKLDNAPISLCVERFDHCISNNGELIRIHQEDCCQAMGLHPTEKYANDATIKGSDPSYKKIADILKKYSKHPEEELFELLKQVTVNLAMGNVDAHAKNYALLYKSLCVPELSPMYDIAPVSDVETGATHLSMRINNKIIAKEITQNDLCKEAQSWGIPYEEACSTINTTLNNLATGIASANTLYSEAAEKYSASVGERISFLRSS